MSRDDHEESTQKCRLFIIGGRDLSEDDLRGAFGEYGTIKELWVVKDKKTGENKDVCYITFNKSSEAFLAKENLNGVKICGLSKPLKVVIASDKREGNKREADEDLNYVRIFIKVKKEWTKEDITTEFSQFGEIDHVHVLSDRETKENKGLAFVTFNRSYCAALALEECDPSYKAVFAVPERKRFNENAGGDYRRDDGRDLRREYVRDRPEYAYDNFRERGSLLPPMDAVPHRDLMMGYGVGSTETCIEIMAPTALPEEHLHRLVDLIPGMEFCDLDKRTGIAIVRYATPAAAAFAKKKLSGFEYPLGQRLGVRFPKTPTAQNGFQGDRYASGPPRGDPYGMPEPDNLQSIVNTLKQATTALAAAGINLPGVTDTSARLGDNSPSGGEKNYVTYTNVALPKRQVLARKEDPVEERLFIVSKPDAFDPEILTDLFCRFGNLIDVSFQRGRNFGYAKYARKESADMAVSLLHGETIAGNRIKVLIADKPKQDDDDARSPNTKRMKNDS